MAAAEGEPGVRAAAGAQLEAEEPAAGRRTARGRSARPSTARQVEIAAGDRGRRRRGDFRAGAQAPQAAVPAPKVARSRPSSLSFFERVLLLPGGAQLERVTTVSRWSSRPGKAQRDAAALVLRRAGRWLFPRRSKASAPRRQGVPRQRRPMAPPSVSPPAASSTASRRPTRSPARRPVSKVGPSGPLPPPSSGKARAVRRHRAGRRAGAAAGFSAAIVGPPLGDQELGGGEALGFRPGGGPRGAREIGSAGGRGRRQLAHVVAVPFEGEVEDPVRARGGAEAAPCSRVSRWASSAAFEAETP